VEGPTTRVRLRVGPGASSSGVVGRYGEGWKVRVTAAPADGRANTAVVRLLSSTLGVAERDVRILSGQASRDKVVALHGLTSEQVDALLASAAGGGP
jgi:uncharacterized protein (TIGR00251 family)